MKLEYSQIVHVTKRWLFPHFSVSTQDCFHISCPYQDLLLVMDMSSSVSTSLFPLIMAIFSDLIAISILPSSPIDFHCVSSSADGSDSGMPVPHKSS